MFKVAQWFLEQVEHEGSENKLKNFNDAGGSLT